MNANATLLYRIVETHTDWYETGETNIGQSFYKWIGIDLNMMSEKYPLNFDPLVNAEFDNEGGGITTVDYTFEQQLQDGSWREIGDPRHQFSSSDYSPSANTPECDCLQDGCQACDPQVTYVFFTEGDFAEDFEIGYTVDFCRICDKPRTVYEKTLFRSSDLCLDCLSEHGARYCKYCNTQLLSAEDDRICDKCKRSHSRTCITQGCRENAMCDDGRCFTCRYDFDAHCYGCRLRLHDGHDKLCAGCRYIYARRRMWRRVVQACQFWRKK
jgi:hypothetical protein